MDAIHAITRSSRGLALVDVGPGPAIITDGDVRRAIERHGDQVFRLRTSDLMTRDPVRVSLGTRVEDALALMDRKKITALLVFDNDDLVGIFKK